MESLFYASSPQLRPSERSKSSSNSSPSTSTTHSSSHHQFKDFLKGRTGSYSSRSTCPSPRTTRNNSTASLNSLHHHTAAPADSEFDRMPDNNSHAALNKAAALTPPQSSSNADGRPATSSRASAKLPSKNKKFSNYQYTSSVWVGGGVAVVDRKYTPRPPQTADPAVGPRPLVRSNSAAGRANSVSSGSGTHSTASSTNNNFSGVAALAKEGQHPHSSSANDTFLIHPFIKRNGRRYLRDPSIPYPLPCDLTELHRQILRTELLVNVFGGPVCAPGIANKLPKKVLEVGCGTGYWSSLCHKYFARDGHIAHFTGIDVVPLAADLSKHHDMRWKFVRHDLRRLPLPFKDGEFDFIMLKDLGVVTPSSGLQQSLMDEYLRILQPGGTLEIWEGDNTLRMLLPNAQSQNSTPVAEKAQQQDWSGKDSGKDLASATGTYNITSQTPLAAPQNQFLLEYNGWITKGLESKGLTAVPCTHIQPLLLQETEDLADIESRRVAIPLGDIRWEHETTGGPAKKGLSRRTSHEQLSSSTGKGKANDSDRNKHINSAHMAVREIALQTLVQMIEGMEPVLREASGKGQDEWDRWMSNMMNDLMKENGASWGECIEVGAWWATRKKNTKPKVQEVVPRPLDMPLPLPPPPRNLDLPPPPMFLSG